VGDSGFPRDLTPQEKVEAAVMRIVRRTETWIHTHFLTDGFALTAPQRRKIKNEIESFLRLERIVFGVHFEEPRADQGLCIVLECIPLTAVMERIQAHLEKAIEDIPARKPTLKKVRFEDKTSITIK
jgi:hypothetical protein